MRAFKRTVVRYEIEIGDAETLDLIDAETHVTDYAAHHSGGRTLAQVLTAIHGVREFNYASWPKVRFDIDADADSEELHKRISEATDAYLAWCASLEKIPSIVAERVGVAVRDLIP
jgi:hypothetical protein